MFEKLPSGYRLTAAGEEVLEFADQMEASSHLLETRVLRDQSVRGLQWPPGFKLVQGYGVPFRLAV